MSYSRIAPFYDLLTRAVFGNAIAHSKKYFLHDIKTSDKVLIIGGGTGDILNNIRPEIDVTFLDSSIRMIERAQSRAKKNVKFRHGRLEEFNPDENYDVVVIHFFLDLFTDEALIKIVYLIHSCLTPSGKVLVAEFVEEKNWHSLMLHAMYSFFRITTGLQTTQLPNWEKSLEKGFVLNAQKQFYQKFIKSSVYVRST